MKLPTRLAGICGSGTFLITALPGIYQHVMPANLAEVSTDVAPGMDIVETLLMSMGGSIAAAFIGYAIGKILSHPKGRKKKHGLPKKPPLAVARPNEVTTTTDESTPPPLLINPQNQNQE